MLVRRLQRSQTLGAFEKEINQLYTDGKKLKKEYSVASLLTLNQLKQLLKENIIHDYRLIIIMSHKHATALFKNEDKYYYFNPSHTEGEIECSSIDHVAKLIFYHNFFEDTKPSPLALEIFSFDERSPIYPSQQEILERINPSLINENGYTGLLLAALTGCLESARYFLNKKTAIEQVDIKYRTALILAAQNGHLEVVRLLLDKGANINKADNEGWTAFMLTTQNGHLEVVRLLLEKGADINKANNEGWTAFMLAAYTGHLEVVRLLLEKGADIGQTHKKGWTALMFATQNNHSEIVHFLVDNGADLNKKNNNGEMAIDIAKYKGNKSIVKILNNIKDGL